MKRRIAAGVATAVVVVGAAQPVFAAEAQAATTCNVRELTGMGAKVVAVNVPCSKAVYVARAYTQTGWKEVNGFSCRVTREATGTDPGFEPTPTHAASAAGA